MVANSLIVVGLGYGDEGKGSIVDFLCSEFNIEYVVKYSGGHQAGHRVVVGDKEHVFSQYGAGALAGVPTILDREFIIEPLAMRAECKALGNLGACIELYIHEECPVTTPYHRAFCRVREAIVRHGSCGVGIGATRQTDILGIGMTYKDFWSRGDTSPAISKLRRLRSYFLSEAATLGSGGEQKYWDEFSDQFNRNPVQVYDEMRSAFPPATAASVVQQRQARIVFEGSQGVLLDELYGQHPHTTWSTVTPRNALEYPFVDRADAVVIGVMRTYLTRHGRGWIGSQFSGENCNDDPNNQVNDWQGQLRRTSWEANVLKHALYAAKPDCIAMNHMDKDELPDSLGDLPPVAICGYGARRSEKGFVSQKLLEALDGSLCLA
jgi:adenylosuccinate synthase